MSFLTLFVIVLFSCSPATFKTQGTIVNQNFFNEIPFELVNDLIIVKVEIDSKSYNLAFDSGAEIHALDERIASQINFKTIKKLKVNSTTGSKRGQLLAEIPELSIDGIKFNNTAAVFLDLSAIDKMIGCYPIHGLLGNNLMRKSNWQIDYQNKVIRVTDDFSKLKTSNDAHRLKMNAGKSGNIYFDIKIAGKNITSTFDTGYNGKLKVNEMTLLKGLPYQTVEGILGANAVGVTKGEVSYAIVKNFQIEDIEFQNQQVDFNKESSSLIGNGFWKNFTLTIDWKNDELILDPKNEFEKDSLEFFELIIAPNYEKNIIEIHKRIKGIKNHTDISIGTQVLKVNEYDVSNLEDTKLCDFWRTEWKEIKNQNSIQLVIFQDNKEKEIMVNKILLRD